ncbi:MAG: proton-conducting transporter membrane subunit [Eubacteriales bacterium]|nr:proton-conducting transporter membrane subunit [Eubacteriales bacterium]
MIQEVLMFGAILIPMIGALIIGVVPIFKDDKKRNICIFISLVLTLFIVILNCLYGDVSVTVLRLSEKLPILFKKDLMSKWFTMLCSFMWLMVGVFSFEYIKHEENRNRFYIFYLLTLGAILGLGFAGNFVTLYLCFEFMTFLSMPLVLHSGTKEAIQAAKKYLYYSIFGASLGLLNLFFISYYSPILEFLPGGVLNNISLTQNAHTTLLVVSFLSIIGFGAKAGMFPLHAWLPTAHPVAPAPASAVLSGVITKAGVLCIIRTVYYLFGVDFIRGTWVQYAWIILALITVFMGSMLAYNETIFKKRLAYSSVSQVSYILFGLALLNKIAFTGAMLHMYFHSLIKDVLFLTAGAIIYLTHKTNVKDFKAMGKRMPIVMWCFTIASLSLIGIPPLSGFISKWYLCVGSLSLNIQPYAILGPIVLIISALLTAGYLFTITINAFFPGNDFDYNSLEKIKEPKLMTIPMIILTILIVLFGLYPHGLLNIINSIVGTIL